MNGHQYQISEREWSRHQPLYTLLHSWSQYREIQQKIQNGADPEEHRQTIEARSQRLGLDVHGLCREGEAIGFDENLQERIEATADEITDLHVRIRQLEVDDFYHNLSMLLKQQVEPLVERIFREGPVSARQVLKERLTQTPDQSLAEMNDLWPLLQRWSVLPVDPPSSAMLVPLFNHQDREVRERAGRVAGALPNISTPQTSTRSIS